MKNRTHSRIGAAVLAGLVAVVPVVGAVAVAQPAAATQSSVVFLDEYGNEVEPVAIDGPVYSGIQPLPADIEPISADVTPVDGVTSDEDLQKQAREGIAPISADIEPISEEIEPISEEITPINAEVDMGFPWILAGYLVFSAAFTVGAVMFIRRRGLLHR